MCTPERTCIGCRSKRPQTALLRVVIGSGGSVTVSRTAPGRGAWLCNPPAPCLELAKKRRGFERAFRRTLPEGALDELMSTAGHENRETEGGVVSLSASDEAPAEERQDAACVAGERKQNEGGVVSLSASDEAPAEERQDAACVAGERN